jgi:hypothetical protein
MLFPLESVSHFSDPNLTAVGQDCFTADDSALAHAHGSPVSEDANDHLTLELGLALSLAWIVNTCIDAHARRPDPSTRRRLTRAYGA